MRYLPPFNVRRGRARGFTLLEVLVALTVLVLVMGALAKVGGSSGMILGQVEGSTAAGVVAADLCERVRLENEPPETGTRESRVRIGGRDWRVTRTVRPATDSGLLEIVFTVEAPEPHDGRARMTTFRVVSR